MDAFEKGMLIRHATLGLGKVVALEPRALHVYFVGRDSRFAVKLRLPDAATLLRPADPGERAWIGGPATFSLDPSSGRFGHSEGWIPHDEAVARFLAIFPGGFSDARYVGAKSTRPSLAARLRRARAAFDRAFPDPGGGRTPTDGELASWVNGALAVERAAGITQAGADRASLAAGLRDPAPTRAFFASLFELLATEAPARAPFEALCAAVARFPADGCGAAWPLVTLLPFVARPDRHVLIRPKATIKGAQRLGLDLRFAPDPNWATYSTYLHACGTLLERLAPLGARDHVDVEAFMAVAAARPAAPPSPEAQG